MNKKERKEMFYLMTHSTHFIYCYMPSDIMVKDQSDSKREQTYCCHYMVYSFQIARDVLYALSHKQDSTYHTIVFVTPVVEHWIE